MIEQWVEMPSGWIHTGGLKSFRWETSGSSATAAILLYLALILNCRKVQSVDEEFELPDGQRHHQDRLELSYSELQTITNLSKEKLSQGIRVLESQNLVVIDRGGYKNAYRITEFGKTPWAKLPKRHLYRGADRSLRAFAAFTLRHRRELEALKIYLLLLAFRDNQENLTRLGYEKINEYAGVRGNDIRGALSLLVTNNLLHTDRGYDRDQEKNSPTQYFLIGLQSTRKQEFLAP